MQPPPTPTNRALLRNLEQRAAAQAAAANTEATAGDIINPVAPAAGGTPASRKQKTRFSMVMEREGAATTATGHAPAGARAFVEEDSPGGRPPSLSAAKRAEITRLSDRKAALGAAGGGGRVRFSEVMERESSGLPPPPPPAPQGQGGSRSRRGLSLTEQAAAAASSPKPLPATPKTKPAPKPAAAEPALAAAGTPTKASRPGLAASSGGRSFSKIMERESEVCCLRPCRSSACLCILHAAAAILFCCPPACACAVYICLHYLILSLSVL